MLSYFIIITLWKSIYCPPSETESSVWLTITLGWALWCPVCCISSFSDVHWEFCWQQNRHRSSNICWIWAFAKKFFRLSALYLQHVKNIPCCFGLKFIFHLSLPTSVQQKCLFTLKALITTVSVKLLSHLLTRFRPKVESRKKRLCSIDCPKWRISAPQRLLRIKQEDVVHVDHSNDQVFSGNQVSKKRVMRN